MKTKRTEQDLIDSARSELDKSCDRLDGQTLSRLNKIRHDAIERRAQTNWFMSLLSMRGFVSACLVLVVVSVWTQQNQNPVIDENVRTSSSTLEDLEILTSTDSIEFYEDFEFYQWLAANEASA